MAERVEQASEDDLRSLELYLDGTLTASQRRAFEERLAVDAALGHKLRATQQLERELRATTQEHLNNQSLRPAAETRIRSAMHAVLAGPAPPGPVPEAATSVQPPATTQE